MRIIADAVVVENVPWSQLARTQCVHSYGFDLDAPGTWGDRARDPGQQPVTLPLIQPHPRFP